MRDVDAFLNRACRSDRVTAAREVLARIDGGV
jgi:hypothetical protein